MASNAGNDEIILLFSARGYKRFTYFAVAEKQASRRNKYKAGL
jgi:hypothetical protein